MSKLFLRCGVGVLTRRSCSDPLLSSRSPVVAMYNGAVLNTVLLALISMLCPMTRRVSNPVFLRNAVLTHQCLLARFLLLFLLSYETSSDVRQKSIDAITVANQAMMRGRPWHDPQAQTFSMMHAQATEGCVDGGSEGKCARDLRSVCESSGRFAD